MQTPPPWFTSREIEYTTWLVQFEEAKVKLEVMFVFMFWSEKLERCLEKGNHLPKNSEIFMRATFRAGLFFEGHIMLSSASFSLHWREKVLIQPPGGFSQIGLGPAPDLQINLRLWRIFRQEAKQQNMIYKMEKIQIITSLRNKSITMIDIVCFCFLKSSETYLMTQLRITFVTYFPFWKSIWNPPFNFANPMQFHHASALAFSSSLTPAQNSRTRGVPS